MVDEKKLLEIFKQKHFQGDSYYCRINNKGDKYIVGYKNDYPMQHGNGKEWTMPIEVAEMIAGQVEPEVMVKLADILQILDDEEYTVSVHSNDTIDDKISESIANTAIIDFKKQLKQELLSKFSA